MNTPKLICIMAPMFKQAENLVTWLDGTPTKINRATSKIYSTKAEYVVILGDMAKRERLYGMDFDNCYIIDEAYLRRAPGYYLTMGVVDSRRGHSHIDSTQFYKYFDGDFYGGEK